MTELINLPGCDGCTATVVVSDLIDAFHSLPMTTRMRVAGVVLQGASILDDRPYPLQAVWSRDDLDLMADRWDERDEAKKRRAQMVESLSTDLKDLSHATVHAVELVANHLISKGWRKS